MTYLDLLRIELKKKGYSYDKLAKELNISKNTISNYLTGRTKIDIETFWKICQLIERPISYFFEEKPSGRNIIQNAGIVNGSHINIQQTIAHSRELEKENQYLREKVKDLEAQIDLLRQMIEILKNSKSNFPLGEGGQGD